MSSCIRPRAARLDRLLKGTLMQTVEGEPAHGHEPLMESEVKGFALTVAEISTLALFSEAHAMALAPWSLRLL